MRGLTLQAPWLAGAILAPAERGDLFLAAVTGLTFEQALDFLIRTYTGVCRANEVARDDAIGLVAHYWDNRPHTHSFTPSLIKAKSEKA